MCGRKDVKKIVVLTCSFIMFIGTGCGPSSEELAITMVAQTEQSSAQTFAAMPTDTPTSTPAPPTFTHTPTFTFVPSTPTLFSFAGLTKFIENIRILRVFTFDNNNDWGGRIENGVLEVIDVDRAGLGSVIILREGYGILVNFKYTIGTEFQIYFSRTTLRKSLGMYMYSNETYIIHSKNGIDLLKGEGRDVTHLGGSLALAPDKWYSLIMAIGKDGELFY
jgi:hypothetical protein